MNVNGRERIRMERFVGSMNDQPFKLIPSKRDAPLLLIVGRADLGCSACNLVLARFDPNDLMQTPVLWVIRCYDCGVDSILPTRVSSKHHCRASSLKGQ